MASLLKAVLFAQTDLSPIFALSCTHLKNFKTASRAASDL